MWLQGRDEAEINPTGAKHASCVLGGTGQVGLATADCLLKAGWTVTLAHRGLRLVPSDLLERGAEAVRLDRDEPGALARALSSGVDALIDGVAYGPEDARRHFDYEREDALRDGSAGAIDRRRAKGPPEPTSC